MKNVRVAFEEFEGDKIQLPPGYQEVGCHMIFDIKMSENFRRKARMVAGGHTTETPSALTYASVVSMDSVRIALTIAALNDLKNWRVTFRMHTSLPNEWRRSGTVQYPSSDPMRGSS